MIKITRTTECITRKFVEKKACLSHLADSWSFYPNATFISKEKLQNNLSTAIFKTICSMNSSVSSPKIFHKNTDKNSDYITWMRLRSIGKFGIAAIQPCSLAPDWNTGNCNEMRKQETIRKRYPWINKFNSGTRAGGKKITKVLDLEIL